MSYRIALVALNSLYTLKKAIIITYEDEGEIERNGLRIEISVLYALNGRKVTIWNLIRYEKVNIKRI